jgi:putative PIG3 family NAD(P)H quinone oxidoreductase
MRAIVNTAAGGPEVLELREVPTPQPGSHQVLVRVQAAGLNRADILQRKGRYPAPPGWPADIPGLEYAGIVETLGPEVTTWRPGDRVMGLVGGGAHAEYVVVHEAEALAVPAGMELSAAAAIPEAFLTAWDALVARGRLQRGERVLLHAVGSGVGTAAVQLAKWLGASVAGTSRTPEKLKRAQELGMDEGIDTSGDWTIGRLGDWSFDVIVDVLGGPAFAGNLAALAPRGRLVLLGFLQGSRADVSLEPILRKRLEVIGSVMRTRSLEERMDLVRAFAREVLPHFGGGVIGQSGDPVSESPSPRDRGVTRQSPDRRIAQTPLHPTVGATFPFSDVARAHAAMERDAVFGKIVLRW